MSFRRQVVEDIGFDEQLAGHGFADSKDLTFRVSEKYCLVLDPKVKGYHRGGSHLYNLRQDHEKRVSGEWYFFRKNIDNTPLNTLFFLWRMFGSLLVALLESIHYGSLDPLRGFLMGTRAGAVQCRKVSPKGITDTRPGKGLKTEALTS